MLITRLHFHVFALKITSFHRADIFLCIEDNVNIGNGKWILADFDLMVHGLIRTLFTLFFVLTLLF